MLRDYWQVTKPGIVGGNVLAAGAGFLLGSGRHVDPWLLASTLAGIALVIASACVLNNVLDRDIDCIMSRTRQRVLANGTMPCGLAIPYAVALGIAGGAILLARGDLVPAGIVLGGFLVYVGLYTGCLKRRTEWSVMVGGLAGAVPPVAGYCAASGRLDMSALLLGLVFCLWQVPHFHAIAIYRLADYRAAAMPVWPLSRGIVAARRQMIGCIFAYIAATQLLVSVGRIDVELGAVSYVVTAGAGVAWLYLALRGDASTSGSHWARQTFIGSLAALAALGVTIVMHSVLTTN